MIPKRAFDSTTRNYTIRHGAGPRRNEWRPLKQGERELGSFILPPFQRPAVWTPGQKTRFIESIWLHLPLASYVVNYDDRDELGYPCDAWLLDGQQRWTTIVEYVADAFPVYDLLFSQLTEPQRLRFENHPFPAVETRNLTAAQCEDIYDRLAYGGTNH